MPEKPKIDLQYHFKSSSNSDQGTETAIPIRKKPNSDQGTETAIPIRKKPKNKQRQQ